MRWWWSIGVVVVAWVAVVGQVAAVGKESSSPYRILVLDPIGSKSHKNFFMGISNTLADRGHQVTVVTGFKPSKTRPNVREVVVEAVNVLDYMPNLFESGMSGPMQLTFDSPEICTKALGDQAVQDLLKEEFDVALITMFLSMCFCSIPYQLQIPHIIISPAGSMGLLDDWIGNPSFPSFVGFPIFEGKHPLTFTQRAMATIGDTLGTAIYTYYLMPQMDAACRAQGLCPADMPSLNDLQHNASLLIINNVRALDSPARPHMPNVIPAGGIHCHPSKPLPQDLEEWALGAGDDGFIFFSLGSAVKPSQMPEKYRRVFVNVFGSLKQRVLWKWDQDTIPDLPPNVRLGKWLPQQDILGHPSLRLFITHGGLLSTLESAYHGIPILGIPVFADQQSNMAQVKREGAGQVINWADMDEESLTQAIMDVMTSESMAAEAKRRSLVMRDQIQEPGEVAAYWVEYVIRHQGAPHLRSPLHDLYWFQVYNADVWLTVLAVMLVSLYLNFRILRFICSYLYSFRSKKKKE